MEQYPQNSSTNINEGCFALLAGFLGGGIAAILVLVVLLACVIITCVVGAIWLGNSIDTEGLFFLADFLMR